MRILFLSAIYPTPLAPRTIGGAEIFARKFVDNLSQAGHEIEVVRAEPTSRLDVEICNGVRVHSAPARNIYQPFHAPTSAIARGMWHLIDDVPAVVAPLRKVLDQFAPDVVHTNTLSGLTTGIWQAARARGVPVVHTLHDYYLTCPRCNRFKDGHNCGDTCFACKLFTVRRRRAASFVDAVVGVSRRILDLHANAGLFDTAKIQAVIPNASSLVDFRDDERTAARPLVFGYIGRIAAEKGVETMLSAFADIAPSLARLVVAGRVSDTQREQYRALAPQASITFTGFVPAERFYEQVDVVVVPSIWEEPGALVLAEAHAANRPILGTRFGGTPEFVEPGVTGWIAGEDAASLSHKLKEIAAAPEKVEVMRKYLRRRAAVRTIENVTSEYIELYRQVTSRRGSLGPKPNWARESTIGP
jgi:glycosyltransferase involved in cell wall biosynthesis